MNYVPETLDLMRGFNDACKPEPVPLGITAGVSAERYHVRELGVVSKSALDELDKSPAHYRSWVSGVQREPTAALKFGSALHVALLEPQRFAKSYKVKPDFGDCRNAGNKARRDAWLSEHAHAIQISADDETKILGMLDSVMKHPAASRLILDGEPEVTIRWQDEISGLQCKSRADYWVKARRLAVDLKSTEDASPKGFSRSTHNYRYHVQDALYRAGFAACGEPIEHFAILAVEKDPPYAVAVYTLDEDAVTKGYAAARQGIERLADCLRHNEWPSYSDGVETLSLPPWAA